MMLRPIGVRNKRTGYFTGLTVSSNGFDANVVNSVPIIVTSGSYGGGITFLDTAGPAYAGAYTQSLGTEFVIFAGMTAGEKASENIVGRVTTLGDYFPGLVCVAMTATSNQTVIAGYGAYVPGTYDAATFTIDVEAGAVMEVG